MAGKVTIDLSDDNDLLVSSKVIAKILQVSQQTIANWVRLGMPKIIGDKNPTYPVRGCVEWAIANGKLNIEFNADDTSRELLPPDLRDKLASAELKEEKLKVMRAEYGPIREMERIAYGIGDFVKSGMLSIPGRISSIVAKETDQHKCEMIMRNEIISVMQDMADQIDNLGGEMEESATQAIK